MPKLTFFELVTKEQLAFKEDSPDFNLVGGAGRKVKDKMPRDKKHGDHAGSSVGLIILVYTD